MAAKITTSGKVFLGILALLAILLLASSYLTPNPKPTTNIYCAPDCAPQTVPIGLPTLAKGCFINQTECQTAQASGQIQNDGRIVVGFTNSVSKVAHIGSARLLNVTVKQIYIRENNQDWISVFDGSKTFHAISLANRTAVVVDTNIPIKTYDQEKIIFGSGQIKIYSLLYNNFGNIAYTLLPGSNETVLLNQFTPSQSETTFLVFNLNGEITHTADGYVLPQNFTFSNSTFSNDQQPSNSILIS